MVQCRPFCLSNDLKQNDTKRNDLNLYRINNLELTFIDPNKSNIIVGFIYRHPRIDLFEFILFFFLLIWRLQSWFISIWQA